MTTQPKKQTPTQTIRTWIKDFVTKPNPIFGDLPPCPFAQKAMVDGKVEFLELDGIGEFGTIFTHIWDFDFDNKDVLVLIAELEAKLDTKDRLLDEALQKIKDIHDDSTKETDTHRDDPELD